MEQVITVNRNGQVQLPGPLRKKLKLNQGDKLKAQVQGQKLVLEKLKKKNADTNDAIAWVQNAVRRLGSRMTRQEALAALQPEFMQRLSQKTQQRIAELGLTEEQIEREILEECRDIKRKQRPKK